MKSSILLLLLLIIGCKTYMRIEKRSIRPERQTLRNARIVCYYANWAYRRMGEYKFTPDNIDPNLCTHVLYAYAGLQNGDGIVSLDPKQDIANDGYSEFVKLKKANPNLKVMLSVGGTQEGPASFSKMASDPVLRVLTAHSARSFLMNFGFDGLDLVWQYPGFFERSSPLDKENYVKLVMAFKEEFKDDLGLSMSVPYLGQLIKVGFDLPKLTKYLDFLNIMTYNYHESTEPTVNHIAPLYSIREDKIFKTQNIDTTIKMYMDEGIDLAKFNLGIPLFGVSYLLEDPLETDIGSPTLDEGAGNDKKGAISYNVLCKMVENNEWTVVHVNKTALGPYAFKDNMWIAYDDAEMIGNKGRYAAEMKMGGLMFWTIDMDDFRGTCGSGPFPLINAGKESFLQYHSISRRRHSSTLTTISANISAENEKHKTAKNPEQFTTLNQHSANVSSEPNQVSVTPRPERSSFIMSKKSPMMSVSIITMGEDLNDPPTENDVPLPLDLIPNLNKTKYFYSSRDILFQNVKIGINNYDKEPSKN